MIHEEQMLVSKNKYQQFLTFLENIISILKKVKSSKKLLKKSNLKCYCFAESGIPIVQPYLFLFLLKSKYQLAEKIYSDNR
jgi:hypothetical protein